MRQFWATERSLKMMKNPFISPQKLLLFSRYLGFCLDLLLIQQNGFIRKMKLISSFMASQPGQQIIVVHILPNISKVGQLMEYNMRNNFLEKSYTKCDGETSPRPLSEKLKLSISLDQQSKVCYSLFLLHAKWRAIEIYRN